MKQKNIYFYTNLLAWGLVFLLAGNYVFGWTTPTSDPPDGDLSAPLDMSSTEQTKTGNLVIDSLLKVGRYSSAPTGATGALYYDTTENEFKGYKASSWDSLGGGEDTDTWITTQTCSTDYALQSVGKESKVCINKVDYSDVAYDLSCTDCIGPTEITDSYILNTSDSMSGNLTVAGDVGIGTTSPGAKLDVAGMLGIMSSRATYVDASEDDSARAHIFVTNANAGDFSQLAGSLVIQARTHTSVYRDIIFAGGINEAGPLMIIEGEGNVGINTTNPNQKLTVMGQIAAQSVSWSGSGAMSLGINVNASSGGATYMLLASRHTSDGDSTDSAMYLVRCGYNGDHYSATYIGGDVNFLAFSLSSSVLYATGSGSAVIYVAIYGNRNR